MDVPKFTLVKLVSAATFEESVAIYQSNKTLETGLSAKDVRKLANTCFEHGFLGGRDETYSFTTIPAPIVNEFGAHEKPLSFNELYDFRTFYMGLNTDI
ncbi:MAG: hypothetical protein WCI72_02090 [archaeon]